MASGSFDFVSFVIGLLLGLIIMLILIWIAYFTRSFLFTFCPVQTPSCAAGDYLNDPGDALANNPQLTASDILFLDSNNELFYNRVVRTNDCSPQNPIVFIEFPQYCSFSTTGGTAGIWKETAFNSNIYNPDGFSGPTITTTGSCQPVPGSPVVSGVPLVRWDANPIS
jgi:hypothetical protein